MMRFLQRRLSPARRLLGLYHAVARERLPRAELDELARQRYEQLLVHCWEHNAFYRERWRSAGLRSAEQIRQGWQPPVVTKADVAANWDAIISAGFDLEDGRVRGTSGSSGEPLRVFTPTETLDYCIPVHARGLFALGMRPWEKTAYVKTEPRVLAPGQGKVTHARQMGLFPTVFVSVHQSSDDFVAQLEHERPAVLASYPSKVLEVAADIDHARLQALGLRGIVTAAEMSTRRDRDTLSAAFGCPVLDEYGSEEAWTIANECPEHRYHVHMDMVRIEILDDDDQPVEPGTVGRVVITALANRGMPFIRYVQGDLAALDPAPCSCGRSTPVFATLAGRASEMFSLPGGRVVSANSIMNTMVETPEVYDLRRFQVVQTRLDTFRLAFEPMGADDSAAEACRRSLERLFGAGVRVDKDTAIIDDRGVSGKRKFIWSEVDPSPASAPGSDT